MRGDKWHDVVPAQLLDDTLDKFVAKHKDEKIAIIQMLQVGV